jgi:hypothetical protein
MKNSKSKNSIAGATEANWRDVEIDAWRPRRFDFCALRKCCELTNPVLSFHYQERLTRACKELQRCILAD